ncbi:hypothetical protein BHE74_00042169 [Ensete ventricosum]|nr:hypothetical protein BHE74_00042169 [Ensete ventricosum]
MSSGCAAGLCLGQTPTMVRYEKLTATTESAASSPRFTWWNETHSGRRKYLRTHTSFEKETAPGKTKKWLKEKKEKKEKRKKKKKMMKKKKRVTASNSSCFAFRAMLDCLLSCMVKVDVVEH